MDGLSRDLAVSISDTCECNSHQCELSPALL